MGGNWTGVLGAIQRAEVDTACLLYQRTYPREKTFSFTEQVYMVQTALAVRKRDDAITSGMWEIFQSYSTLTWASMGLSLVVHILMCIYIARTEVALKLRRSFEPLD
ncbi:Protein W02A2.5, partial [Aphelenchoides avenae]